MNWDNCPGGGMLLTGSINPADCPATVVIELPGDDFFEDISTQLSFNPFQRNYGVAVTDINADGKLDFVVAGFGTRNLAYTWNEEKGAYDEIASQSLQDSNRKAIGLAACDIDGDGFEELYVLNTDKYSGGTTTSDALFDFIEGEHVDLFTEERNKASGNFVAGRSCACLDRDGSGKYGVAVANYGGKLKLFELDYSENADGVLFDAAPEAGMDLELGGRALVAGPIVSERTDLFANNEVDFTSRNRWGQSDRANYMFVSNGDGTFTNQADALGVADESNTGRGTALLDSNGDGLVDIVYGNWRSQHRLYVQEREGDKVSFKDVATAAMQIRSSIRTVIVADFDNDGYEELFWNNIPGDNRLFRKLPTDDDWVQINMGDAVEPDGMGTGAAVGDFDGDGMLELVVSHGESGPLQPLTLYRAKAGHDNHYLRVIPRTLAGAPARGSRVDLTAGGRTQMRVIDSGSGYLCQMEPVAHFGLGTLASFAADAAASVRVQWPDGSVCQFVPTAVDVEVTVTQPNTSGDACGVQYPGSASTAAASGQNGQGDGTSTPAENGQGDGTTTPSQNGQGDNNTAPAPAVTQTACADLGVTLCKKAKKTGRCVAAGATSCKDPPSKATCNGLQDKKSCKDAGCNKFNKASKPRCDFVAPGGGSSQQPSSASTANGGSPQNGGSAQNGAGVPAANNANGASSGQNGAAATTATTSKKRRRRRRAKAKSSRKTKARRRRRRRQ